MHVEYIEIFSLMIIVINRFPGASVKVIGIRYLRDLHKGSFTVEQRPVPSPHVPSVKGGWPHTANPSQLNGEVRQARAAGRGLGDRLYKEKDVKHSRCYSKSFRSMLVQAIQIVI